MLIGADVKGSGTPPQSLPIRAFPTLRADPFEKYRRQRRLGANHDIRCTLKTSWTAHRIRQGIEGQYDIYAIAEAEFSPRHSISCSNWPAMF
jgi:hypothetical protein